MQRSCVFVLVALALSAQSVALAGPRRAMPQTPPMVVAAQAYGQPRSNLGGGFIEYLFGDRGPQVAAPPPNLYPYGTQRRAYANAPAMINPPMEQRRNFRMDPRFARQEVNYDGKEAPGTIVIDTPNHFLYLVEGDGKAMRYGIGVGRPGFTWSGTHEISAKKEWPDWVPPKEMLERQPYLPRRMSGGPNNPLGARALYLGSTLYRIHGSNEPWTIGHNVSSGCIRMRNADVIDLYDRVKVGSKVKVL
jgi:lipoprotein-anchoring transpeptidase ErfK/SrfK